MTVNDLMDYLIEYNRLIQDGGHHEVKSWDLPTNSYAICETLRVNDADDMNPFCEIIFT
jgi:hypothetical protein